MTEPKILCKYDELVSVDSLKPYPRNRNSHSKEQIERLALLIENHGMRAPVVISNRSQFIMKGHGTTSAFKFKGWAKIPVVYQDFDSDELEYTFVQSDNAIAAWSELDLSGVHTDIAEIGPFDIQLLGIRDFQFEPDPSDTSSEDDVVQEVNRGDENSEWVGDMPEFKEGEAYIKLIFQFKTELERELFVKSHDIVIDRKMNNQWIVQK